MKYDAQILLNRLVHVLSQFDGVECITLNEAAIPASLDPYFALILDVFCNGEIPQAAEREKIFSKDDSSENKISSFETYGEKDRFKDRFLYADIPVHIEYKATKKIESLIDIAEKGKETLWLVKDSGTYGYYRLSEGEVLFTRGGWLENIRNRLNKLGNSFWVSMRQSSQSKMEHFLIDLGAALIQGDNFFYEMSAAGFIKNACLTLFCINKQFEPSHRAYYKYVTSLPILSEAFSAQLETFLRNDSETTPQRRYSIAQVIAKGIVVL
ncbi:MAG: hypothetical protein Ta2F_03430 [Termitinemataceae bacterium]|nr:MAG: hypothetical protein Ta2F_03430 [Termitinemataceae bacterium]